MTSIKIYNTEGKTVGEQEVSEKHFSVKPSSTLIHEVVVAQLANKRRSTAHTKTRGEVSGGGKKPWKQKGTGRARHGSIRSPLWKGGGVTFGPRNDRNYSVKINRKTKQKALFMILSDRLNHEKLIAVDQFNIETPKTKIFAEWMKNLPFGRKTMVVVSQSNPMLLRMVRNIQNVQLVTVNSLHVADLIKYPTIIFEQSALKAFEEIYK